MTSQQPKVIVRLMRSRKDDYTPSTVTRHIATSKINPEREGVSKRPLFSSIVDNLTWSQANRWINADRPQPAKADLIYFIISIRRKLFDSLGTTDEERKICMRKALRQTMLEVERILEAQRIFWVAGILLNTDNPNLQVVLSRDFLDYRLEYLRRIKHMPRVLLPHYKKESDGSKQFFPGVIAEQFLTEIEKQQSPSLN